MIISLKFDKSNKTLKGEFVLRRSGGRLDKKQLLQSPGLRLGDKQNKFYLAGCGDFNQMLSLSHIDSSTF